MPGPWLSMADDPEYVQGCHVAAGSFYEFRVNDNEGRPQGTIIAEVKTDGRIGDNFSARYLAASDPYYSHWMDDGCFPGVGFYHLCAGKAASCGKGDSERIHVDGFRTLTLDDVKEKKVKWVRGPMARKVLNAMEEMGDKHDENEAVATGVKAKSKPGPKPRGKRAKRAENGNIEPERSREVDHGSDAEADGKEERLFEKPRGADRKRHEGRLSGEIAELRRD